MSCYFGQASEVVCEFKLYKPAEWLVGCYFVQASGVVCGLLFLYKPAEWFVSCYFVQTSRVVCELLSCASQWSGL